MDIRVLLFACVCLVVRVKGAAYDETCTGTGVGDCTPNANLVCDAATTKCKCDTNYVWDTGFTPAAACKLKVGQGCGTGVNVCVTPSTCVSTTCTCPAAGYKAKDELCVETYDSACTTANVATDCTNSLAHSTCKDSMCKCADGYKVNAATPKTCIAVIGMACSAAADCNVRDISKAECSSTTCRCMNGYYGVTCMKVSGMKTCTSDGDCSALKHSRCSSGKCACAENAVAEDDVCKLKVAQTCVTGDLCPNNAQCTGTPKKCACASAYKVANDKCEAENAGMAVKMSLMLMVAALLSVFLH